MPKSKSKQNKQKNSTDKEENKDATTEATATATDTEMPDFNKAPDKVPDEFYKIIKDFTEDITTTFPEYKPIINKWWGTPSDIEDPQKILEDKDNKTEFVFAHCLRVIPERFFDILYQNDSMFAQDSNINTEFLPGVVFKYLWSCDISDSTRETIWKYLQLILFSLLNSVKSSKDFGDSAKLFEAINEEELKSKLEETVNHMQNMFENGDASSASSSSSSSENGGINMENMPSAESMHEHIQEMMKGNLGKLAMELAEEAAQDLNLDMENVSSANDAFKQMFKNPSKLMNIVKNLGSKLDAKIKSGEIKESELISEGMEMLNKMKSMPGMGNMQEMFAKMGMPGMPTGKGKVNVNAMESQMQKNFKMAQMKERMRKKAEENKSTSSSSTANATANANATATALTDEQLISVFSKGEKSEKTPRGAKAPLANTTSKESTKTPEKAKATSTEKEKKKKN